MKKIYNYHPDSGEFIGEGVARESPLKPEEHLVPAYATSVAPPATKDGHAVVFAGGNWALVPDVRGQWYSAAGPVWLEDLAADVSEMTRMKPPSVAHELIGGVWVLNETIAQAEAARAAQQIEDGLTKAVQQHLDATAQGLGYDDIRSAVTYAEEPAVPKYQTDGRALRAWRSLVWAACYEKLLMVQAGKEAVPTADELIKSLPAFKKG